MGNITTKSVGDFQANVGIFDADINVIISYFIAGILIITAIVLAILAFIPMKPWNCGDLSAQKDNVDFLCSKQINPITGVPMPILDPEACHEAQQAYDNEKTRCNTNTKHTWLLWFLFLIPLAVLIVFGMKWWDNLVHKNRTAAQIGGTMFELQTAKDIFSN